MTITESQVNAAFTSVISQVDAAQRDPDVGMDVIRRLSESGTELRMWIDTANAFGHHATTILLLKRMVAYGFKATIRILFTDPKSDPSKLEMLLPGYTAGDSELTYRDVLLKFHYDERPPSTPATLLLSGGSDAKLQELEERLHLANCGFYLQLQPWHWGPLDRLIHRGEDGRLVDVILDGKPTLGGAAFTYHAYTEPAVARDDEIWDRYAASERFKTRVEMAKLLADAAPGKYVMPVYGLERMNMWGAVLTLVLGAVAAQDQMATRVPQIPVQPIVLLVFNRLDDWWQELEAWLDGTSTDADYPPALKQYVTQHEISKRVGLNYETAKNPLLLKQQLEYTVGRRLLVVAMDGTPDEIFRYFYSTATMPFVFEGRGTQNLALNVKLPYLCSASDGYPSLSFTDVAPPAAMQAKATVKWLNRLDSDYEVDDPARWPSSKFASALCDVMQDPSGKAYFEQLATVYGSPANDKLRMALRYLRTIPGFPV